MRVICRGVGVAFPAGAGTVHALQGVCFETRDHEFVSVVGPSGCGKTTLLRVIAGLQPVSEGAVERTPEPSDHNRLVLLVSQEKGLFPWMTVIENAAFGLEMQGMARKEREARARELLAKLGFSGRERAWPHELSVGMKQRVAVARAFLCDPAVMLMDEPFAALDCLKRLELQQELIGLWERRPKTVVFVTHDVEEAILLSDRVLVLSRQPGTVVAEFAVRFPRPRKVEITMTEDFLELKRRIAGAVGLSLPTEAPCG